MTPMKLSEWLLSEAADCARDSVYARRIGNDADAEGFSVAAARLRRVARDLRDDALDTLVNGPAAL